MENAKKYNCRRNINLCVYIVFPVLFTVCIGLLVGLTLCKKNEGPPREDPSAVLPTMPITKTHYGEVDGHSVDLYTLSNDVAKVKIINYGGTITSIEVPDKNGKLVDVALGFDSMEEYKENAPYFGCIVGRYANRIAKGRFTLDGHEYHLDINNPPNTLHGGKIGFNKRVWDAAVDGDRLVLNYTSADGEEGYPGEVKVTVTYRLTADNELVIDYRANTTKATVINLTNHAYFNLAGHAAGSISDHTIRLDAEYYTPTDNVSIPLGTIDPVEGTMFDLRVDTQMGPRIPQIPGGIGFDINYALERSGWDKHVARVVHPISGRTLDMYSTEPGVQFYTAHYLNITGKGGAQYKPYSAFCLEAQHYPDSPNEPRFPSTILRPGKEYKQTTKYVFGVKS